MTIAPLDMNLKLELNALGLPEPPAVIGESAIARRSPGGQV